MPTPRSFRLITILALACALLFGASARAAGTATDGESILSGLFFGHGPVAQLFPEVWAPLRALGYDPDSADHAAFRELATRAISTDNPDFLSQFAAEMRSGDHLRVQGAMARAASLIQAALPGQTQTDLVGKQWLDKVFNVSTFAYFAETSSFAIYKNTTIVLIPVHPTEGDGDLERETYVDWVTTRLSDPFDCAPNCAR